jgi:hypothetical protein
MQGRQFRLSTAKESFAHRAKAKRKMTQQEVSVVCLILFWLFACPFLGYMIGRQKCAGNHGVLLGLLFGPIGVLITALIDRRPNCPECGTKLNGKPSICPACKTRFSWTGNTCTFVPPEH